MTRSLAALQTELSEKFGPNPPRILAVSKTQSAEKVLELHRLGQKSFAENYAQEALTKIEKLRNEPIEWHFIGGLQKNKVKMIVGQFSHIHSVDSLELAEKISRVAAEKQIMQKIFLQINLAGEKTKGGFAPPLAEFAALKISKLPHVELVGLMTMPPLFENPEQARPYFKNLKSLQEKLNLLVPAITELSMGTSTDYLVAAEEGSTWLRIGTMLFGARPPKIN